MEDCTNREREFTKLCVVPLSVIALAMYVAGMWYEVCADRACKPGVPGLKVRSSWNFDGVTPLVCTL